MPVPAPVRVAIVKVVLGWFAGIVTETGTLATLGWLPESAITAPPAGAGPLNVSVPVDVMPD